MQRWVGHKIRLDYTGVCEAKPLYQERLTEYRKGTLLGDSKIKFIQKCIFDILKYYLNIRKTILGNYCLLKGIL